MNPSHATKSYPHRLHAEAYIPSDIHTPVVMATHLGIQNAINPFHFRYQTSRIKLIFTAFNAFVELRDG